MANFNIDYLVVAGGAGGGPGYQAGGGGAGGMRTSFGTGNFNGGLQPVETSLSLTTGTTYSINVGNGGAGGTGSNPTSNKGADGLNSYIDTLVESIGGGGGSSYNNYNQGGLGLQGSPGGSGGGSAPNNLQPSVTGGVRVTNPIQGFDGGDSLSYSTPYFGAGGGGAGGQGGVSNGANTGLGGLGLENAITGVNTFYAGGGGGGSYYANLGAPAAGGSGIGGNGATASSANGGSVVSPTAGAANTGSGGGGGGDNGEVGGNGGSGIVILRYATADVASYETTGIPPTEDTTTVAGQTILSFTNVQSSSITFTAPPTPPPPTFDGTKVTTPVTGFESGVDIGLKIPVGTNSNIPTGVEGMIRNDTEEVSGGTNSTTAITFYNGTDWKYFTSTVSQDSPPIEIFNTVLYGGTGNSNQITGVGFQPDLVWVKRTNVATSDHYIVDTVRGNGNNTYKNLASNKTTAEGTTTSSGITNSTIVDGGFTVQGTGARTNANGSDYVAWCFKAGGAAVANTDGTIASQVSANVNAGFSIVKGSAPTNGYPNTFGHGLGQQPDMIITKLTNVASDWTVIFPKESNALLKLNTTGVFTYDSFFEGTSTTLKTGYTTAAFDFIAYCFVSKPGLSKVGSYVGNGTTGNNKVDTGFEPAFVMIKSSTNWFSSWLIIDNKRVESNGNLSELFADTSSAESGSGYDIDFNVDGFTLNTTTNNANRNNEPYIYLAFAI